MRAMQVASRTEWGLSRTLVPRTARLANKAVTPMKACSGCLCRGTVWLLLIGKFGVERQGETSRPVQPNPMTGQRGSRSIEGELERVGGPKGHMGEPDAQNADPCSGVWRSRGSLSEGSPGPVPDVPVWPRIEARLAEEEVGRRARQSSTDKEGRQRRERHTHQVQGLNEGR